ncbi:RNA-binding protein rnp24 [Papiliotrema laurentii]|uniref:RNA-binding protein rnp24 n=1 Tax=Papiliotrema laurentii TaxID=5418 RepID=A0AAD9FP54_PAPLA|nr:RNA-binding protein rnp24 [Papiliotrema laurentii]
MSTEVSQKTGKSGRTPEQQAARDARKAAKKAAAEALVAESSTAATAGDAQNGEQPGGEEQRGNQEGDEDLLEIDVDAPEPLSKAEARAAKKRQKKGLPELPPKPAGSKPKRKRDDSDDEEEGEKKPRYQNSIWVGNLAYKTTVDTLKGFFENGIQKAGRSTLGAITRVNMPKKPGKGEFASNRGFAYVDFATPELQEIAINLSESFFEGRKLLIKRGDDHAVKPDAITPRPEKARMEPGSAAILKKQIHKESATLFVGNLPFDATEEGLRDFIEENAMTGSGSNATPVETAKKEEEKADGEEAGEGAENADEEGKEGEAAKEYVDKRGGKLSGLRKVRLGAFEDTGRCKGFAFLDFHTPESATRTLVNRKNHFYGGRRLNLQYASEEATKRSGGNRNLPERLDESTEDGPEHTGYSGRTYDAAQDAPEPKKDQRGKRWEATGRPRPGAALAMAKREKVGIVKAEGAKIVFD